MGNRGVEDYVSASWTGMLLVNHLDVKLDQLFLDELLWDDHPRRNLHTWL